MEPTSHLEDTPDGFAAFYHLLFARPLPRHVLEDWVRPLYAARAGDVPYSVEPSRNSNANSANLPSSPVVPKRCSQGLIVQAFRGSSKTTSLSVAFAAFRLGMQPHKSILIIQASNQAARATCQQIADLIEHNPGWSQAFPDVVPDKDIHWSVARGYELKRTEMDYDSWRVACQREKGRDPALIGFGYRSSIIGLHPSGLLLVDDIHDESNTRSARELQKVIDILTGTILPAVNPGAWQIFVGTPWVRNDALHQMIATEQYASVSTPIYTEVPIEESSTPDASKSVISNEGAHENLSFRIL